MIDLALDIIVVYLSIHWFNSFIGLFLVLLLTAYPFITKWNEIMSQDTIEKKYKVCTSCLPFQIITRIAFIGLMVVKHMNLI